MHIYRPCIYTNLTNHEYPDFVRRRNSGGGGYYWVSGDSLRGMRWYSGIESCIARKNCSITISKKHNVSLNIKFCFS